MSAILLDTCAAIWLAEGIPMSEPARLRIVEAATADQVFVSPVSAWEVGMLCASGRFLYAKTEAAVQNWISKLLARSGVHIAPFTPTVANRRRASARVGPPRPG